MSVYKVPLEQNVLEAAQERIMWTLETLPRVCVSFSGGKDSGLMLHLTATLARKMNKRSTFSSLTGKRNSPVPSPILNRYVNTTRTLLSVFIGSHYP